MSRTYRRKPEGLTKHWNRYGKKTRVGGQGNFERELPAFYRNAKRVRCAAAGSMKWLFKSQSAAVKAAGYNFHQRIDRGKAKEYERAYFCKACGGFHLTTMDRDAWKDRKQEIAEVCGTELDGKGNFKKGKPLSRCPDGDLW